MDDNDEIVFSFVKGWRVILHAVIDVVMMIAFSGHLAAARYIWNTNRKSISRSIKEYFFSKYHIGYLSFHWRNELSSNLFKGVKNIFALTKLLWSKKSRGEVFVQLHVDDITQLFHSRLRFKSHRSVGNFKKIRSKIDRFFVFACNDYLANLLSWLCGTRTSHIYGPKLSCLNWRKLPHLFSPLLQ